MHGNMYLPRLRQNVMVRYEHSWARNRGRHHGPTYRMLSMDESVQLIPWIEGKHTNCLWFILKRLLSCVDQHGSNNDKAIGECEVDVCGSADRSSVQHDWMPITVVRNCLGFEKTCKEVYAVNLLEYERVHKLFGVAELVYITWEKRVFCMSSLVHANNLHCENIKFQRHDLGLGVLLLSVSCYYSRLFIFFTLGMARLGVIQE